MEKLIGVEELAETLGVPPATVRAWRYRREGPPAIKVGRHVKFRPSAVQAWLDSQADDPRPAA